MNGVHREGYSEQKTRCWRDTRPAAARHTRPVNDDDNPFPVPQALSGQSATVTAFVYSVHSHISALGPAHRDDPKNSEVIRCGEIL